jgi:hypothetical protein
MSCMQPLHVFLITCMHADKRVRVRSACFIHILFCRRSQLLMCILGNTHLSVILYTIIESLPFIYMFQKRHHVNQTRTKCDSMSVLFNSSMQFCMIACRVITLKHAHIHTTTHTFKRSCSPACNLIHTMQIQVCFLRRRQ